MAYEYKYKTEPFEHQKVALRQSLRRREFAFLMEMGTGKSKVEVDEISILWENRRLDTVLIIAEKAVFRNWSRNEIPTHMPDHILAETDICEYTSYWTQKNRDKIDHICRRNPNKLRIMVMNIEAFSQSPKSRKIAEIFVKSATECMIVVDESTRIKHQDSKRTQTVIDIGRLAKYRRILTGSLTANSPLEAYSQFDFLGPGLLGATNFWSFKSKYAVEKINKRLLEQRRAQGHKIAKGREPKYVVGSKNLDLLAAEVAKHSYRVTKAECLDLPEKLWAKRDVEMTDQQWEVYNGLRQQFFSFLENGGSVTVGLAMHQQMRMHQVACGFTKSDDGDIVRFPSERLEVLMDAIEETNDKCIIWSCFAEPAIPDIVEALRANYGETSVAQFWGGIQDERAYLEQLRFQREDDCRFIVATQSKGARGNTWVQSHTVFYYAQTADNEARQQSEDRCHRIGQRNPCLYTDLIATDTSDWEVVQMLRNRIDLSSIVNGDGYRKWLI